MTKLSSDTDDRWGEGAAMDGCAGTARGAEAGGMVGPSAGDGCASSVPPAILWGRTAFDWWRVPPLVRWLASTPDFDGAYPGLDGGSLARAQRELARESGLWRASLAQMGRPPGAVLQALLGEFDRVAPGLSAPLDVVFSTGAARRRSPLVRPHVWRRELPAAALRPVGEGVAVAAPAFVAAGLAAELSLPRLSMVLSELMGTFAVFEAPGPLRAIIEGLHVEGRLANLGDWSPTFDEAGGLLPLWSRPPLLSSDELDAALAAARGTRGYRRLEEAARLVRPSAASPFEAAAGMLLGWPEERGGEGYGGYTFNARVVLSSEAGRLARRRTCCCDLYWPDAGLGALDLECHSRMHHATRDRAVSDADRTSALQLMGVQVIHATYGQLADESRFDSLARLVADRLGRHVAARSEARLSRRRDLRAEVLADWRFLTR